jgi:uncharacterized protein (TIGR02996 family)
MSALPSPLNLDWDDLGDRTLVLLPARLTDEPVLEAVAEEVMRLVDVHSRRHFVLNFVRVPYLTSGPISLLVTLRKRLNEVGGSVELAHVNARCREVLEVTTVVPRMFQIPEEGPVSASPTCEQDAAFRRAIVEAPDNLAPRLMYADWLQERGEPLGEFIRLQCMLEDIPADDPRRTSLNAQAERLESRFKWHWLGPLAPHIAPSCEFRRGFAEEVVLDAPRLLSMADDLFAAQPIRYLKVLYAAPLIDRLAQCRHLARLRDLQFHSNGLGDSEVETLVRSPYLTELRGLHLSSNRITDRGARTLAKAANLTNLVTLNLATNRIGDSGVAELANSPHLARLTQLNLHQNRVGAAGARALAESPFLHRLSTLDLSGLPPGLGSPYPEERNIIPPAEQKALRARFGHDACRF